MYKCDLGKMNLLSLFREPEPSESKTKVVKKKVKKKPAASATGEEPTKKKKKWVYHDDVVSFFKKLFSNLITFAIAMYHTLWDIPIMMMIGGQWDF